MRVFARAFTMTAGACLVLGAAGCARMAPHPAPLDAPHSAPLDSARFAQIDQAIESVIRERRMPGAVFHLERAGMAYQKAFGRFSYEDGAAAVTPATVFDAASLTKIVATAPSVMLLAEDGRVALDAPLVRYLPECAGQGRDAITVRHLLTHTSGLPAGLPATPAWHGLPKALELACSRTPTDAPGAAFRYSDVNYILLGELVRRVSGTPLDRFAQGAHFYAAENARQRLCPAVVVRRRAHRADPAPAGRIAAPVAGRGA